MKIKNEDKKDISVYIPDVPLYLLEYILKYLRQNWILVWMIDQTKGQEPHFDCIKEKKKNN